MDITKQYNDFNEIYHNNIVYDDKSTDIFYSNLDFELYDKKLLDLGCGGGEDLSLLKKRGAIIHGVDPSIECLKDAKRRNPTGCFREGLSEKIPFEDNYFDAVISKWALQTSEKIKESLAEIARVTKKGGHVLILTKHPWQQWLEKQRDYGSTVDYYTSMRVTSFIYEGKITLTEPTHTMQEYFDADFFRKFEILDFIENSNFPASEQINGFSYPSFLIIKARKK